MVRRVNHDEVPLNNNGLKGLSLDKPAEPGEGALRPALSPAAREDTGRDKQNVSARRCASALFLYYECKTHADLFYFWRKICKKKLRIYNWYPYFCKWWIYLKKKVVYTCIFLHLVRIHPVLSLKF